MKLAQRGLSQDEVMTRLGELKRSDLDWQSGKAFGYVFDAGTDVKEMARRAAGQFLFENGLDPTVFQSLLAMEKDVVGFCAGLVGGDSPAVGNFTSGGTESIMLALKAAREWARQRRPEVTAPEVVLADTAHAAFHKGAHYLGLRTVVVPALAGAFHADVAAMAEAITGNTIVLVGSAPSYAHGVVDDIVSLGALARERELWLHVDACMGGILLPYLARLGQDVPAFDFSVPGVSSLSMDLHKYGYAAKGASVVLYREKSLRRHQMYACSEWTGYTVVNATVQSTKSGAALAAAWAVLQHLGEEGYLELARAVRSATGHIIEGIAAMDDLEILGRPDMSLVAFTSETVDVFHLVDEMRALGWYIQPQFAHNASPANVHLTITAAHEPHADQFLADLARAVERAKGLEPGPLVASLGDMLGSIDTSATRPETFASMLAMAGIRGAELPERMAEINQVLNALPPTLREGVLTAFFNDLY